MRHIKFKGVFKVRDNGYYSEDEKNYIESKRHEILSISIGSHCTIAYQDTVMTVFEMQCSNYDILQFTDLVDRNGKEIYHKDRVNHESYGEGIIEWDDRFATFFVNFGIEDLELQMIILNECELLNEKQ